jgi:hypothetical protein
MASSKKAYVPPHKRATSFIPKEIPRLLEEKTDERSIEYALFTQHNLEKLDKGNAGYGGIVPWYIDEQDHELKFILTISKKYNGLLGYIGGGIKARFKPFSAIMKEVHEETPQWEDYLKSIIYNPSYKRHILVRDEYYPKDAERTHGSLRMSILMFIRVDPRIINERTFVNSKEIKELYIAPMRNVPSYTPPPSFVSLWEGYEHGLTNGLIQLVQMLSNTTLFSSFWHYIRDNLTLEEYKGLLRLLYEQNNIENKVVWVKNQSNTNNNNNNNVSLSKSPRRSTSKSPRRSTSKSPRRSTQKK